MDLSVLDSLREAEQGAPAEQAVARQPASKFKIRARARPGTTAAQPKPAAEKSKAAPQAAELAAAEVQAAQPDAASKAAQPDAAPKATRPVASHASQPPGIQGKAGRPSVPAPAPCAAEQTTQHTRGATLQPEPPLQPAAPLQPVVPLGRTPEAAPAATVQAAGTAKPRPKATAARRQKAPAKAPKPPRAAGSQRLPPRAPALGGAQGDDAGAARGELENGLPAAAQNKGPRRRRATALVAQERTRATAADEADSDEEPASASPAARPQGSELVLHAGTSGGSEAEADGGEEGSVAGEEPGAGRKRKRRRQAAGKVGRPRGAALADKEIDPGRMTLQEIIYTLDAKDRRNKAEDRQRKLEAEAAAREQGLEVEPLPSTSEAAEQQLGGRGGGGGGERSLAPQVAVVDGRIVVQEESLTVQAGPSQHVEYRRVEEEHRLVNAFTHMKRGTLERWTEQETNLFYRALRQFGLDFTLIARLFPKRGRKGVKARYLKEGRERPERLEEVLRQNAKGIDIAEYRQLIADLRAINQGGAAADGASAEEADGAGEGGDAGGEAGGVEARGDAAARAVEAVSTQDTEKEVATAVAPTDDGAATLQSPARMRRRQRPARQTAPAAAPAATAAAAAGDESQGGTMTQAERYARQYGDQMEEDEPGYYY